MERFEKKTIAMSEYRSVRHDLVSEIRRDFFGRRTAHLSPGEMQTLYLMSQGPDADMEFSSILNATGYGRGALSPHLRRLEDKGIIYRHSRGRYKFALPMLKVHLDAGPAGPA